MACENVTKFEETKTIDEAKAICQRDKNCIAVQSAPCKNNTATNLCPKGSKLTVQYMRLTELWCSETPTRRYNSDVYLKSDASGIFSVIQYY